MSPLSAIRAPRPRDDAALTSRAARADAAAFVEVYDRHHQALYRYCRSILRHDEDARDALQSTMLRGFAALQSEERDFALKPWLFRIAHNEAVAILRQRRPVDALDAAADLGHDTLDRALEDRSRLTRLRADLADLPDKQRAALVLRELSGLSHDEIAQAIGSTPRNVKQTIFEARTALHEFREGHDMSCEPVRRAISDGDGRVLRGRRIRAHLRSCDGCRRFRAELRRRPAELAALAPPLPIAAGTALLAHLLPAGATVATTAGSASTGLFAGAAGKAAVVAAVAATAAGGTAGLPRAAHVLGIDRPSGTTATPRPSAARATARVEVAASAPAPAKDRPPSPPGQPAEAPAHAAPAKAPAAAKHHPPSPPGQPAGTPTQGTPAKDHASPASGKPAGTPAHGTPAKAPAAAKHHPPPATGKPAGTPAPGTPAKAPPAAKHHPPSATGKPARTPAQGTPPKAPAAAKDHPPSSPGKPARTPAHGTPAKAPAAAEEQPSPATGKPAPAANAPTAAAPPIVVPPAHGNPHRP